MLNAIDGKIINIVAVNRSRQRRKLPRLHRLFEIAEAQCAQRRARELANETEKAAAAVAEPDRIIVIEGDSATRIKLAAEKARLQAEERAKAEAAEKERLQAEERAKAEAAEKARLQAEERAKAEAAEKERLQVEEKAKAEAAEKERLQAEEKAKAEAAEKERLQAEEKAKAEAAEKERLQAEEKAKAEAAEKERLQAEEKAKAEAAEKERLQAEEKAKAEAAEKARLQAEAKVVAIKKPVAQKPTAPEIKENPILKKIATRRARKLIYSPKEALFEGTCTIDVGREKNDGGEKIKEIIEKKIAEGLKLGYLDKYDGLKAGELKEEYENDTVYELADQEFKKMGIMLDGDEVKVYLFDWTGLGFTHIGYLPADEAKLVRPYLEKMDDYSFDLCGIITGGKSKTVTKDEATGKITVTKGKDGDYGIDLDITVIPRKD